MSDQGQGIRGKEAFRILGIHPNEGYGLVGARAHALDQVAEYTVPAALQRAIKTERIGYRQK